MVETVTKLVKQAYDAARGAVTAAHYRTGGLSTLTLTRLPLIVSGIFAGAVTLDHLLDQNFHLHLFSGGWVAGAEHEKYDISGFHVRVGLPSKVDACHTRYLYRFIETPPDHFDVEVIHNDCAEPQSNSTGDNVWQIAVAAGLVVFGIGAYLVLKRRRSAKERLAQRPPAMPLPAYYVPPAPIKTIPTSPNLEGILTAIEGIENSARTGGVDTAALEGMRANMRKELARAYARGELLEDKYKELRERVK